jgi:hypothetical protein
LVAGVWIASAWSEQRCSATALQRQTHEHTGVQHEREVFPAPKGPVHAEQLWPLHRAALPSRQLVDEPHQLHQPPQTLAEVPTLSDSPSCTVPCTAPGAVLALVLESLETSGGSEGGGGKV